MKSDLIDLTVHRHAETDKAIRVSDDGDDQRAVWLPKTLCEIDPTKRPNIVIVTMPEWLAAEKGLI